MDLKGNYIINIGSHRFDSENKSIFTIKDKKPNNKKIQVLNDIILIISKFDSIDEFDNVVLDAKEMFKMLCPQEE